MAEVEGVAAARLRASERCCDLFISRGTTDLTIAEIADVIGVSQRTFYRYFPTKAESVSPVFDWTTARFEETITKAAPGAPLPEVLLAAFRAGLGGAQEARTRALFPLVFADAEMWSVFLRKVHDGERSFVSIIAPRLASGADSVAARTAAAAVASATRIALEVMVTADADPEAVYANTIDAFASGVIRQQ
ncbi:TetR/AcrR family transcriptional regulator [Microbacterium sp.]|uniref:TetR/AcrR family transcriptional regulator n=1 Tax=Microbacterium sp. TaxID=51671 RepID=UPI0025FEE3C9|nr:TetR/AcrR family transcriptional regulator [Microbacterium sp.]MBT9607606.1 TetR family transcriptional regulator [Microbacterium sp.]